MLVNMYKTLLKKQKQKHNSYSFTNLDYVSISVSIRLNQVELGIFLNLSLKCCMFNAVFKTQIMGIIRVKMKHHCIKL